MGDLLSHATAGFFAGAAAGGAVSSTIMGADPGVGVLYAIGAAGLSLGVQYAWSKYQQEQQYYSRKDGQTAAADNVDQTGKVSLKNHGKNYARLIKYRQLQNGYCVDQGCNLDITIGPTPAKITPNLGLPEPYGVKITVNLNAPIWGGVAVTGTSYAVPEAIYGIPLGPPFSFEGVVIGNRPSFFMFNVMDVTGHSSGRQMRRVEYGDVKLF